MKEDEPIMIHGKLHEFANGFTIELVDGAKKDSSDLSPRIYHGTPKFPYERVRNFLHQETDILVNNNQGIVNIELIKPSEGSGNTAKPKTLKTLLQSFLHWRTR